MKSELEIFHFSRDRCLFLFSRKTASSVDFVVENIEKEIKQSANVCNMTKSVDIKPTKECTTNKIEFTVNATLL